MQGVEDLADECLAHVVTRREQTLGMLGEQQGQPAVGRLRGVEIPLAGAAEAEHGVVADEDLASLPFQAVAHRVTRGVAVQQ
jgi:hypothetical protein